MAPHASETAADDLHKLEKLVAPQAAPRKYEIIYFNILTFLYWHIAGLWGLYQCFTTAKWATIGFSIFWYILGELGVISGAHRLWAHRSYKANWPLQVILMIFNCIGFQNTATDWVRNHRLHHKHSDTDADPHNATRGFFYSHVGWLLVRKHPEVKRWGKLIDMSDIYGNAVLRFQKKYAIPLIGSLCFVMPTLIPVYFWNEALLVSWNICMLRYCCSLNGTWLINSVAHMYGNRPYDRNISPRQNTITSVMTLGEGFHNYHHVFSWDYRAAELGNNWLNVSTWFIDFFAKIGWAYDLKMASDEMIKRRMERTGDGTNLWGWGDKDMKKEDMDGAEILCPEAK